jgi:hypothetical protein
MVSQNGIASYKSHGEVIHIARDMVDIGLIPRSMPNVTNSAHDAFTMMRTNNGLSLDRVLKIAP